MKIKSAIFRKEASGDRPTFRAYTHSCSVLHTKRLYVLCHVFRLELLLHSMHRAAFVSHLHSPTLTTASCVLPWAFISAHFTLPVWQETAGQLTRLRRTPAAWSDFIHGYVHLLWQQSVICPLPSRSMWRPLSLSRQATQFPHISSPSFPCGQPCQQPSVAWEGRETSDVVGFGGEPHISSLLPPTPLPLTPPHSFSQSLHKRSESVSVHTQSSLYLADMVTVVTSPPQGTWPLLNCPLKPRGDSIPRHKAWPRDVIPWACACVQSRREGGRMSVCSVN